MMFEVNGNPYWYHTVKISNNYPLIISAIGYIGYNKITITTRICLTMFWSYSLSLWHFLLKQY